MMRRLNLLLLAGLPLCSNARHHAFSIHEDMLAHPQFEIVFSDSFISETDAQSLLEDTARRSSPTRSAEPASSSSTSTPTSTPDSKDGSRSSSSGSSGSGQGTGGDDPFDEDEDFPMVSETYELINVPPSRYLCAIPVLAPPPPLNQTATELAKAEEAREISRASTKGWELVGGMRDQCLYYVSGWWSYSFCYNSEVVQFHALPPTVKGGLPVRDPKSQEYVLGRASLPTKPHNNRGGAAVVDAQEQAEQAVLNTGTAAAGGQGQTQQPPNTELSAKGDQWFLVQRFEHGTVCDLTGRPRTIEIQYYCAPGLTNDRVGWIKEVTTCAYVMMVQTPRLCADAAFLPPKPTRAHPISCRLVVSSDEEAARWHRAKTIEARLAMGGAAAVAGASQGQQQSSSSSFQNFHQKAPGHNPGGGPRDWTGMRIGGVVVGGRKILGGGGDQKTPVKLAPPTPRRIGTVRNAGGGALVEVLAIAKSRARGGAVEVLPDDELERLELDPATVDALRRELQELAGDKGWKLEMIEEPGAIPELRGVVHESDDDDDDVDDEYYTAQTGSGGGAQSGSGGGKGRQEYRAAAPEGDRRAVGNDRDRKENAAAAGRRAQQRQQDEGAEGQETGSEEKFFHEEL